MIWLARDIWPNVDGTDSVPFTWNAACKMLNSYCSEWKIDSVTFDDVVILAGALEDPFQLKTLEVESQLSFVDSLINSNAAKCRLHSKRLSLR